LLRRQVVPDVRAAICQGDAGDAGLQCRELRFGVLLGRLLRIA
jgi:hypothetical protein